MTNKPKAVLISDIHFTVDTLEKASEALEKAILYAKNIQVPLIIAGDMLDSKAIIRAECANRIIYLFKKHDAHLIPTFLLVGNHDLINEKSQEHSLNFLKPYCDVVQDPSYEPNLGIFFIPYRSSVQEFKKAVQQSPLGSIIVCHQGLKTAYMGHYVQDTTSISPEFFEGRRVISGHYHKRQDIKCGRNGLFSYLGNPYTLTFGESDDGAKGFSVLFNDGSLHFVPLEIQRHIKIKRNFEDLYLPCSLSRKDKIWLEVIGKKSDLDTIDKHELGQKLFNTNNYKLELTPIDIKTIPIKDSSTDEELLDTLIDSLDETTERKVYLKSLWKELFYDNS